MTSQFEKSEVMLEFAKIVMPPDNLKKEAVLFAIPAGVILAGKIISALLSLYTVYEVSHMVYRYFFAAYNTVKSLISNAEALDPNKLVQKKVELWITTLESFLDFFEEPPTTTDKQEALANMQSRVNGLGQLLGYLKQMQQEWPIVKENLTDWGPDPEQFEKSLISTIASTEALVKKLEEDLKSTYSKAVQERGQATGINYIEVAKDIVALEKKMEQLGDNPVYEKSDMDEGLVRNVALKVHRNEATPEEINQHGTSMVALRDRMLGAVQRLQAKVQKQTPSKRTTSAKPYISKRSFRLESEPPVRGEPRTPRVIKNPQVQLLQRLINRLNIANKTGIDRIEEDGIYGVNTAAAFTGLISKIPELDDYLRRYAGLDEKSVVDFKVMSDPGYLKAAVSVLSALLQQVTGGEAVGQDPTQGTTCDPNKENPSPEEVSACLRSIMMRDPASGQQTSIYMFLQGKGMSEQAMREYIYRKYLARAPRDWSWPEIADDFKRGRYSLF